SGHTSPAVDGRGADTENAGNGGRGFALLDEFHGAATTAFEFSRCSFGSHASLYACPAESVSFFPLESVGEVVCMRKLVVRYLCLSIPHRSRCLNSNCPKN